MISLKCVDENSFEACSYLECTHEQCEFTCSPVWSLLQTAYTPLHKHCKLYAIYNDDIVVGMVRLDFTLHKDCYMFTNLLIDKKYQHNHYATQAVNRILEIFRQEHYFDVVKIHVAPNNENAISLYQKAGFVFTGKTVDDAFYEYSYFI